MINSGRVLIYNGSHRDEEEVVRWSSESPKSEGWRWKVTEPTPGQGRRGSRGLIAFWIQPQECTGLRLPALDQEVFYKTKENKQNCKF